MSNSCEYIFGGKDQKWKNLKAVLLALWLALGAPNFSYSQENIWKNLGGIEQVSKSWGKDIESYKKLIEDINKRVWKTSETLADFSSRMWSQFLYKSKWNNDISYKINEIKNILNSEYSQNIPEDNFENKELIIVQTALKTISNSSEYEWLQSFTAYFSWKSDINFVNAYWFFQYCNNLPCDGSFSESSLDIIIEILSDKKNWNFSSKVDSKINSIISPTSETKNEFINRIGAQFKYEVDNKNSLISKQVWNIKNLLIDKFKLRINNDPVIIIESALKELSKTEKYKWLQEYTSKFSGKFDINFIYAYSFLDYQNSWNYKLKLCDDEGALILQTIYNLLNDIKISESQIINNNEKENTNTDSKKDNTKSNNAKLNDKEIEWITLLSKNLSLNKLNWVTYEDVWNTVNLFKHEWLKNAVMHCLLNNDVIWAQRLLWMDINCSNRYPDYVASEKIWKRELNLMSKFWESRVYMDTQEILNFMEILEKAYDIENYEVKNIYLKILSWELDNEWLPYCIVSKFDYKIYLFSADHKLVSRQPILTWAHAGNKKNNPLPKDNMLPNADSINCSHTTPGWMYEFWWFFDKNSKWKSLVTSFGTDYWLLIPKENQYDYSKDYSMGIHGYINWRARRFSSKKMKDHRISNWCINLDRKIFWEIYNHLKVGSKFYICKDDEVYVSEVIWYNSSDVSERIADNILNNFAKHNPSEIWDSNIFEKRHLHRSKSLNWRNYCNINNQISNTPYYQNKYHNYHQKKYLV